MMKLLRSLLRILAGLAPGRRPAAPDADRLPQGPAPTPAPVPASTPAPVEPATSIASILAPLVKALTPLAEEVGHPLELLDMPAFRAVVAVFRRADASLPLLEQHALGANWPAACAAFVVLAERPDRQSSCEAVLRHLADLRPYVLLYTLRYLTALEIRPPVGIVLLAAPPWWAQNPVIPDFLHEYLARSADLGDEPTFGSRLAHGTRLDADAAIALLARIQHPSAARLLSDLRRWQATRIDLDFLRTVGTVWDPAERDPLLLLPASWQALAETATAAVSQATPRSLLVCGDPRVGKTSFIRLLARQLQRAGWTVFAASGNELMANQMYIGQLEGRLRNVVEALHARRRIVWYVPDLGQIADSGTHSGQTASILDQILPAVAAGNLILIGEASHAASTRLFQSRPSLRALIEVLPLPAMGEEEALALALALGERIAAEQAIEVPRATVATAMDLAQHYLSSGRLPGAVLDLLKRAADRSGADGAAALTADSVITTLAQISGLPPVVIDTRQRVDLARVRAFFSSRLIGQDEAVTAVVDRIAMLKAGLTDPGRPIGVFLFAGPTGTGKTELAKTLAEFLFGSAERLVRLDMSEFQTVESTGKILGHRGERGGDSLIDRIRKQPFAVVLLDEFEKAHPNCWDLFLQIFDDGRLSDAHGREADFRHCIIILTSNLGATAHRGSGLGFRPEASAFAEDQVLRSIGQTFRPEFVNRLDRVIVFKPLSRELMRGILHKELARILERRGLRERAWAVEWEASAIELLLDRGFSPEMGARPLKRAIDQLLLAPLAATMVEHRFPEGDQFLFVRANAGAIEVEFVDPDAEPVGPVDRAEPEADGALSLPSIILGQTGSPAERASLAAAWDEIRKALDGAPWHSRLERLHARLADRDIWSSADRHRIFAAVELADRIAEAARTADRLFQRYAAASSHTPRASRELAGRLALQLYNLRQGMDDLIGESPIDALLRVEPVLEAGGEGGEAARWCERLVAMYVGWAGRRRMQLRTLRPPSGAGPHILSITGFGAFRTLAPEAGLHVLEAEPHGDGSSRMVARVTVAGGPTQEVPAASEYAAAAERLAAVADGTGIVRRYRESPAPLVRDLVGGWRSGRLASVLGGEFELIGAVKRQQAA